MIPFEEKLRTSAKRIANQDNRTLNVPQNPLKQNRTYWGWVATPAAAVVGLVFGMSLHYYIMDNGKWIMENGLPTTDTIRIVQPIHDTLYLTQIVEKEKVIERYLPAPQVAASEENDSSTQTEECTSIQCDGINYAILASN